MGIDNIPFKVIAVSRHVGPDPLTALWDDPHWVLLGNAAPPVFVPHWGAQMCDVIDSGSFF